MSGKGQDRGIYSRHWSIGKVMWYVRCSSGGKYRRFGPFDSKDLARKIYNKVKVLDGLGMPFGADKPRLIPHNIQSPDFGECIYFIQGGTGGPIKIGYTDKSQRDCAPFMH